MNNLRLTFNSSTNFKVPIATYQILQSDAHYFGFMINNKPNISGFLNQLIPTLSIYQEDLFKQLLKYNKGNVKLAKICARSIHNVYLKPFNFHDDGKINIPFRINKKVYDEFITIHDELLSFYDTDFTKYIRTLLTEYTSKTLSQREYLFAFKIIANLRLAIQKEKYCKFYTNNGTIIFAPVAIETSPIYDHNYIIGIDKKNLPKAIRLSETQKLTVLDEKTKFTEKICEDITDYLDLIFKEELSQCSV